MLFYWSKFNRGLKSLKLIFKTFQYQQIDVDTLGKRIKVCVEAAWSGCLLLQQLTGCNDLQLTGKS